MTDYFVTLSDLHAGRGKSRAECRAAMIGGTQSTESEPLLDTVLSCSNATKTGIAVPVMRPMADGSEQQSRHMKTSNARFKSDVNRLLIALPWPCTVRCSAVQYSYAN